MPDAATFLDEPESASSFLDESGGLDSEPQLFIPEPPRSSEELMTRNAQSTLALQKQFGSDVGRGTGPELDQPTIPASILQKVIDYSPYGAVRNALPIPKSARGFLEGVEEAASEGAASMTSGESLAMMPAFAIPGVGQGLMLGLGAKGVGTGLGKLSAAETPKEAGLAVGETALGAGMLIPGAVGGARTLPSLRPAAPKPPIDIQVKVEAAKEIGLTKSAEALEKVTREKASEPVKAVEPVEAKPVQETATTTSLPEALEISKQPLEKIETDLLAARAESDALKATKPPEPSAPMAEKMAYLETTAKAKVAAAVKVQALEEGLKMRKSAERATTAEMVPEPVQEVIKTAPESFYKPQSMPTVEGTVKAMTLEQKLAVPKESDIYTAAKLDAAREYFEKGQNDAGYQVFVELEKEGTRLGQLINQFKLLDGTRPEQVVSVIDVGLKKAGKDWLNPKQTADALKIATDAKAADSKLAAATEAWKADPSEANAAKAESALDASNKAALELQKFTSKFTPRSTSSILKSVLQGNLLTPISETANLVGNMSFLPFRAGTRGVASALDVIDSYLTGKPRELSVGPVSGTVEAGKGVIKGTREIPSILAKGSGDVIKGETRAGLHPIKAWVNQFAKNPEMPTTGGKLTLQDRLNLAIEGTFGVPAEVMLRGLGAGDAPFKAAAHARVIAEQLRLKKVPKEQWSFAQKFPELFFDRETMSQIGADTAAAVFQRESKTLNLATRWLKGQGDIIDFAFATVAPYKLTPWNIIGEVLSYNPLIAMGRTLRDASKGDRRSAKINAGKLVIGSTMAGTAYWLYNKGLIAPSLDERDEAQKSRILSGQVLPPNHINISGLGRVLEEKAKAFAEKREPDLSVVNFRPGDETRDFFRSGGLMGSMLYMTANVGREFEKKPEEGDSMIGPIIRQSTLEQARFGLNQSFLQGVEGLLTAIKEGNTDNFFRQWFSTVLSIPLPNTMATLSRATREYKPDFREAEFKNQVENVVRNRLGFAGLDDYLPLKRDFWGKPLPETPEGRNALFYHFFDVTKGKQVTDDPVALELYRLWRKTADSKVIPSLVNKEITIKNQTSPLDAAQQSRFAELVGAERRRITEAMVINPNFHKLDDENKIRLLNRAYDAGMEIGKIKFLRENPALEPKKPKSGFNP